MLSGLVTGTLGYSLKREFLANAIALRDVESYSFEIYSVDLTGLSAATIQSKIYSQFTGVYSGDINVTVFNTENAIGFPSDSLRAAKFNVTVEVRKPVYNLSTLQTELSSSNYSGLDAAFFTGYAPYLTDFKESFSFATNTNGNREFNHDLSFGLRTGWGSGGATQTGRKSYAQQIASGIFAKDKNTPFGIATMIGSISTVGDSGQTRNYFSESYDLMRNTYSFARRRELLPIDVVSGVANIANSFNLGLDGLVEVTEKTTIQGNKDFSQTRAGLDSYLSTSFSRCSGVYAQFYNSGIALQDSQYSGTAWYLPLINTALRTVKNYDARSLTASYDVAYGNNPIITGGDSTIFQTVEFDIDLFDRLDAYHSFDFVTNRVVNDSGKFITLMTSITGSSPSYMSSYYSTWYPDLVAKYPAFNLVKATATWPNIKSKSTVKLNYSNNPSFFISYDGMFFRILDYSIDDKRPVDVVNEYKIVNRPTKTSVLSYGYQTEPGEVVVNMRVSLGKQSLTFYPDGVGSFTSFEGQPLWRWLQAIYKYGGELLMQQFDYPTTDLNWFLSDSKFTLDSEGNMTIQLNYTYSYKKRNPGDFM